MKKAELLTHVEIARQVMEHQQEKLEKEMDEVLARTDLDFNEKMAKRERLWGQVLGLSFALGVLKDIE